MSEQYLAHYGILGQKWGVRRYQNSDGSLTPAGEKRYGTNKGKVRSDTVQKTKNQRKQEALTTRSPKTLFKNADTLTDVELRTRYNRLALERDVKRLSEELDPKKISKVDQFIKTANKASDFFTSGSKLYNSIARIHNATVDGPKWKIIEGVGSDSKKKKK